MSESIAEAFEAAEKQLKKFEKKAVEPSKITDRQLRYAMSVVGRIVKQYDAPYGYHRGDLFQAAMIKIIGAINRNPDLELAWMGKAAHWACINAIRQYRFDTDRGDGFRSSEWLPNVHSPRALDSYPYEIDNLLERLTKRQQKIALYLTSGYSEKETAKALNVHPSTVGWHKQKIRDSIDPPVPKPKLCGNKIHVMEGENVYIRPNGRLTCVPCAQAARERNKMAKRRKKTSLT